MFFPAFARIFGWCSIITLLAACAGGLNAPVVSGGGAIPRLSEQEALALGNKIWKNESGGKIEGLIVWNKGEEFPSLGIGHFIWYPQGYRGPFRETFPDLLRFLHSQGAALPAWLQSFPACPWTERDTFLSGKSDPRMLSLHKLLVDTVPMQARFIVQRLDKSFPQMLKSLPSQAERDRVYRQFKRVAQTPTGIYALVDYLNFKGEGTGVNEYYNGQGWGLLQVLQAMPGTTADAAGEFADAAAFLLRRRVQNAPPQRGEERWLAGWLNRVNTYRSSAR